MKRFQILWVGLWLAAGPVASAQGKWVWHKERGWIETNALPRETEQQRYEYALALMTDEKFESALVEFGRLIREARGGTLAQDCEFHCVECYYRMGKEWDAFRSAEQFLAKYPDSRWKTDVVDLEFRAGAKAAQEGERWGVRILEAVLAHDPNGPLAPKCHLEIGKYWQKREYYETAEQSYGQLIERFPDSPEAPEGLLRASVCALERSRWRSARPAALGQARSNLEHYRERYGKEGKSEAVTEYLRVVSGLETVKKKYEIRFYYALLDYLQERYATARGRFAKCARKLRGSELGGESRFYVAECLYHLDKPYDAFKAFEKFFVQYPGHERQADAGKRQYEICGILRKTDLSKAAWAYGQVVTRSPYASFADDAQMEAGNCHMELRKYVPAETAYEALLKAYPDSEWFGAAIFQLGKCNLERSKVVNEGGSLRLMAEDRLEDYVTRYPSGIKVAEARQCLREIKELKAADAFEVAEFYMRVKRPDAALVYLEAIKRDFSDTSWAPRAEERAKRIRAGKKG